MGPPSSGGLLVVHMLNMFEKIMKDQDHDLSFNSVNYIHILTELERRAYADRTEHMGDSDFWNVPKSMFLSNDYADKRLKDIDFSKASISKSIKHGNPYLNQSEETTHYSIVDKQGNAISVTTTINAGYGNGITVTGAGFLLNNEMDDFSSKPGEPNMFGLLGNEANAIEAKKRPLSSMTPTIVLKNNRPFLILGSPGGSTASFGAPHLLRAGGTGGPSADHGAPGEYPVGKGVGGGGVSWRAGGALRWQPAPRGIGARWSLLLRRCSSARKREFP